MQRIIVSFDGGPVEAFVIEQLAAAGDVEVVALTVDRGQPGDLGPVREQALAAGAVRAHVLDGREALASEYLLPALQARALHDAPDVALALSAPLVARLLVDVAVMEGATSVAYPARTGGPNPVAVAVSALSPTLRVVAIDVSPVPLADSLAGVRGNLWVRSSPAATAEGFAAHAPTRTPAGAPRAGATLDLDFVRGVPSAVNGVTVALPELLEIVTTIAGDHGIGRSSRHGRDDAGAPVVYESPGGTVLTLAHAALDAVVNDADVRDLGRTCATVYRDLILRGAWFSPAREAIDALVARVQQRISGTVHLRLLEGACEVAGVTPAADTDEDGRRVPTHILRSS